MQKADRTRAALCLTLAVMLLRLPVSWLLALLMPDAGSDPAAYYAAVMAQESLLWGLPALLLRPWRGRKPLERPRCLGMAAAMVPLGVVAQAAMTAVTALWSDAIGAQQASVLLPQNAVQWVLVVLALAVVPALAEEAFFRGGMLHALLEAVGTWPALALTTVIFALMHGSLAGLPAHLSVSLLCGLAMLSSGRLWISMVLHMSYNGAALLLRDVPVAWLPALPMGIILAAAALVLAARIRPVRGRKRLAWPDWLLMAAVLLGAAAVYWPELI